MPEQDPNKVEYHEGLLEAYRKLSAKFNETGKGKSNVVVDLPDNSRYILEDTDSGDIVINLAGGGLFYLSRNPRKGYLPDVIDGDEFDDEQQVIDLIDQMINTGTFEQQFKKD